MTPVVESIQADSYQGRPGDQIFVRATEDLKMATVTVEYSTSIDSKSFFNEKITFLMSVGIFLLSFSSCQVVGGIFKAGFWVGVFAVVIVIGIVLYFVSRKKN